MLIDMIKEQALYISLLKRPVGFLGGIGGAFDAIMGHFGK